MENNIVKVSLWGQTVGEIYWDEKRKRNMQRDIEVREQSLLRTEVLVIAL